MTGEMTVNYLAERYWSLLRPKGLVIDSSQVLMLAIRATEYYKGFGGLISIGEMADDVILPETVLNGSEWAVISPLFELYVERENALILESSRVLGVEVYGRTVSEIANDITQKEQEIQNLAFQEDFITIG